MNYKNSTIGIETSHFNGITSGILKNSLIRISPFVLRSAVVFTMRNKSFGLPQVE